MRLLFYIPKKGGWNKMHKHLFLLMAMCSVTACTKTTMSSSASPAYPQAPQVTPSIQASAGQQSVQSSPMSSSPSSQQAGQGQQAAPPAYMYESAQSKRVEELINQIQDRMERLERAMVRLDRRMQLIERRELNRMSGREQEGAADIKTSAQDMPDAWRQSWAENMQGGQRTPPMNQAQYGAGMMPMSQAVTSPLQAAPAKRGESSLKSNSVRASGLPSLAESEKKRLPASEMAVWTIEYEGNEVWPSREALPDSREVVRALREEDGQVTLFARGGDVRSRAFRERVRAISRYLSKVSSINSVPIATMESRHMDDDTIEVFATR